MSRRKVVYFTRIEFLRKILYKNTRIIAVQHTLKSWFNEGFGHGPKSRLTLDLSKRKQSGPYELLSSCRLTAVSKRIMRCVFAEWKRVQNMCRLARTHVLLIKHIYEYIFNFFFLK